MSDRTLAKPRAASKLAFPKKIHGFDIVNTIFLFTLILIVLVPLAKVVIDSFDQAASETTFRLVPQTFTVDAYVNLVSRPNLTQPFLVSLYMTAFGTLGSVLVTMLMAYALAQPNIPGKRFFLNMAMVTMVFRAGMIPLFMVIRNLGLMNTQISVVIVHLVDAYYLLLLRSFFISIPSSVVEAARIDGATPWQIFWRVILPLSKPGLAAIGLFYLVLFWNQWFEYILYIQKYPALHNFQVFLRSLVIESDSQGYEGFSFATQTLKNASIIISIIPVLIMYPLAQKHFVKGINLGAVKE